MPHKKRFDLADLGMVNPRRAGRAALHVLDKVQVELTPEEQIAGMALCFLTVCEVYGCHPGTALGVAQNIGKSDLTYYPEIKGLQMYVQKELADAN